MHLGLGNSQKAKRFRKFVTRSSTKFDGTDDVITTSADSTLATKTYSFWAKSTRTAANGVFDHGANVKGAFYLNFSSGRPLLWASGTWFRYWDDNPAQDDGNWHHYLLLLHTNVANSKLFIDGVEQTVNQTNTADGAAQAYTTGIRIGRGGGTFFSGSLDEFAIFDGDQSALADELYNNGQPTKIRTTPNLDHWFRMGEGKDGTNVDGTQNLLFQGLPTTRGSEKVTNGDFSSATGWDLPSGATVSGGKLNIDGNVGLVNLYIDLDDGAPYEVTYEVSNYTSGIARSYINGTQGVVVTANGVYREILLAGSTNTRLGFNPSGVLSIDNFSVKKLTNVGTINGARIQADGGTELVANGSFSGIADGTDPVGNISGYTAYGTPDTREISGERLKIASNSHNQGVRIEFPQLVVGATYKFSVDVSGDVGTNGIHINNSPSISLTTTVGTVEHQFVNSSGGGTREIFFRGGDNSAGNTTFYDNISLKEVTESVPKKTQNLPSAGSAKSMSFDATDEFVDTGFQPDFIHTDATISFWCNMANFSGNQALGCFSSGKQFYVGFQDAKASFALQATGKSSTDISAHITAGLWHHIALVADGGTATYYVDGVARDTHSYTPAASANPDTNFFIGAIPNGSGGRTYHMEGSVSEVAVWDTALDGDAVKALYNAGEPTPVATKTGAYDIYRDNLKAYYRMGDSTNPAADGTSNLLFDQTNPGVGSELISDGGFDDPSAWNATGSAVVSDGIGNFPNSNNSFLIKTGVLSVGNLIRTYKLQFDVLSTNGAALQISGGSSGFNQAALPTASVGTKTVFLTSDGGGLTQLAIHNNAAFVGSIDNVSLREVNGNTGTITGATIQTEAPKQIYALPPVANTKSINFDGTNDHLVTQVDDTLPPSGESRYYSFWCKASDTSATAKQAIFGHGGSGKGAFFFNYSSSRPLLIFSGAVFQYWVDNPAQDSGEWAHWVVKIVANDLTACELFCNGVKLAKDSAINSGSMTPYSSGITIGTNLGGNYLEGSIDEFSIHEELDEEAIRALFNRGRPIDISKSQGAYDVSDKALHYWRMGDASRDGYADGTNDIIFQGLETEDSELITNGDFSYGTTGWTPAGSLQAAASDGALLLTHPDAGTWYGNYLPFTSSNLVAGRTYKVTFDAQYVSGTQTLRLAYNSTVVRDLTSANYDSTFQTYEAVFTATFAGSFRVFINGGTGSFKIDNVSVKQVRGQYKDASLVSSDAYHFSKWTMYGDNVFSNPSPNVARVTRVDTVTGDQGAYASTGAGSLLTENQVVGQVYCITFDFETDDSNARARFYAGTGGSYYMFPVGSGSFTYTYVALGLSGILSADSLDVGKYAQWSNIKVQKLIGPAVMTNMTTSDLQLDTPY